MPYKEHQLCKNHMDQLINTTTKLEELELNR